MNPDRRLVLSASAALGVTALMGETLVNDAFAQPAPGYLDPASPGKPGDFDFLQGNWQIAHQRLLKPGEWDRFSGEATCWSILGGVASIEELRIPARDFSGMGLRTLDMKTLVWSDYWMNAKWGVIGSEGVKGGFVRGDGVFLSDDVDGDVAIKVIGLWDLITPTSCRWRQGVSRDGARTWAWNWIMDWTRA
ncbi:MAG: hypothetical protein RIR33_2735 [Pseudomonadota bacterium]|jgi:hypothetical protein